MSGFIEGVARGETVLFPDRLEDWIDDDLLVEELDLMDLGAYAARRCSPKRPFDQHSSFAPPPGS